MCVIRIKGHVTAVSVQEYSTPVKRYYVSSHDKALHVINIMHLHADKMKINNMKIQQ